MALLKNNKNKRIAATKEDRIRLVRFLIGEIQQSVLRCAVNLKRIRDEDLFAVLGYETMTEFVAGELNYIPIDTANRYLSFADYYTANAEQIERSVELLPQIMSAVDDQRVQRLTQEGKVVLRDGTEIPLEDYETNRMAEESAALKKKNAAEFTKLAKEKQNLEDQKTNLKRTNEDLVKEHADEIKKLKAVIDGLTKGTIDPDLLTVASNKKEAQAILMSFWSEIQRQVGRVSQIGEKVIDAELAGEIARTIAAFRSSLESLEDQFSAYIYAGKQDK